MNDFVVFGEILFDCFKDSAKLGGAPLNAAAHLTKLGLRGTLVSAVGDDELGRRALEKLREIGLDARDVALLKDRPTGRADVVMHGADADYEFNEGAAWDFIPCPDSVDESASILYFGTLAQRSRVSRETLATLVRKVKAKYVFYDVNIRKKFYTDEIIKAGLDVCTILKVNDEELPLVARAAGCKTARDIAEQYGIDIVLVTEGERGASAVCRGGQTYRTGIVETSVVDTVGAGDAFSAGFLASLVRGGSPDAALRAGSLLASYVVSRRGAVPDYDAALVSALKKAGVMRA